MSASLGFAFGAWACFGVASLGRWVRSKWLEKALSWLTAGGLGLLSGSLISRGFEAGHWPLMGRYEFALCFAWSAALIQMALETSLETHVVGASSQPVIFALLCYALFVVPASAQAAHPLPPALQSIWLQIHVVSAALAYGAFAVAAGLGGLFLLRGPRIAQSNPASPEDVEGYARQAVGVGFPLLSLSMLSGAIWAQNAWGNYWSWDPKETWALITWLVYLAYLHARGLRDWRGRRAAWLVVGAFGVVLFTFLGVNWLVRQLQLESLHVF